MRLRRAMRPWPDDAGDGGCASGRTGVQPQRPASRSRRCTRAARAPTTARLSPASATPGSYIEGSSCFVQLSLPVTATAPTQGWAVPRPSARALRCGGCENGICVPDVPRAALCGQSDGGAYACGASCPSGQSECSGTCADLTSDAAHCGTCTNACPVVQTCVRGACQCPSAASPDFCSGACTSLQSDAANCGTCGHACTGGETCQAGVCGCPAGTGAFCRGGAPASTPRATRRTAARRARRARAARRASRAPARVRRGPPSAAAPASTSTAPT